MTDQEFANWASGIQSLLIAVGILIGAVWSLYLFNTLKQRDTAENQLQRDQLETSLQTLRLETEMMQRETRRVLGTVTLNTTPVKADTLSGTCYVQVSAEVTNSGLREVHLFFESDDVAPPLTVAGVRLDSAHEFNFSPVTSVGVHSFTARGDAVAPISRAHLVPGETQTYPFLLRLARGGIYLVQFHVAVDTVKFGSPEPTERAPWFWTARSYIDGCSATRGRSEKVTAG